MGAEIPFYTGSSLHCKGWQQEAALRMLLNNLHPDVAENRDQLIVYGGTGKAARNEESLWAIIETLKRLEHDETLMVQSGKPVAVFKTHRDAPRVLIANSHLVGDWATWDEFRRLESLGLTMYGQMTAGSWIYIGTQGILQGTYETFAEAARRHFGGSLAGKLLVTAGLGGMGGAQPLAGVMNEATVLVAEIDPHRVQRRLDTRYVDHVELDLDTAIDRALTLREEQKAESVAWVGNARDLLQRLIARHVTPDVLTDQTSAHDMLYGYVPAGMTLDDADGMRQRQPEAYISAARKTVVDHVQAMLDLQARGAITMDYGNNIRGEAKEQGLTRAFDIPGFVPEYIRPQFCEGRGPFRWVALSGDPADIHATDEAILELFPEDQSLHRWIRKAQDRVAFQGLPARICWLGYGERDRAGLKFNELVASGKVSAPIVIGRDHLDCGSVASPNRETEAMQDGSDAISDWPMLNAMLSAVNGATWTSLHHGGGVGIGKSIHAGMVIVADGTPEAALRLKRVLTGDPGMGVARHADAGYDKALGVARERTLDLPMVDR